MMACTALALRRLQRELFQGGQGASGIALLGLERREDRRRVRLGAAGSEHDLRVVLGTKQRLHLGARVLERCQQLICGSAQ
jgi:hypothetical protein